MKLFRRTEEIAPRSDAHTLATGSGAKTATSDEISPPSVRRASEEAAKVAIPFLTKKFVKTRSAKFIGPQSDRRITVKILNLDNQTMEENDGVRTEDQASR